MQGKGERSEHEPLRRRWMLRVSEFIRHIKKHGIKFDRHGAKHDVYINPKTGQTTEVPRHKDKELGTGLKDAMLNDLGLK